MSVSMSLSQQLKYRPIIAALYGPEKMPAFLRSACNPVILANIQLRKLSNVMDTLIAANKSVIINIDSCDGLSPDKAAIEFLADLGAIGIISTRVPTIQKAVQCSMIAIQKIFVTDRSTLPRSLRAVTQSGASFAQIMPSPMVGYLKMQEKQMLPSIIASGFVCKKDDIVQSITRGAIAVTTSDSSLWDYQLKEGELCHI